MTLLALTRESDKRGPMEGRGRVPASCGYVSAEAEAQSVWNWEPQVIPGLLQTWGYARAERQLWMEMFPGPPSETDRWADTRLMRQQVLTRDPPLDLSVVIDESVLRRRFGNKAVMREQLQHLMASSELPNVEVRIYPLDGDNPP